LFAKLQESQIKTQGFMPSF